MLVQNAPTIAYQVSMENPHHHYVEVTMSLNSLQKFADEDYIDFKMPVWTPGSYLIREYPKHVEAFRAYNQAQTPLRFEKIDKNTWRVHSLETPSEQVHIRYLVYAYDLTVRTSFMDDSHAYINGASVFMYLAKYPEWPASLLIYPYHEWTEISTALKPILDNPFELYVPDYDTLVDSPIEVGNHEVINFLVDDIPHTWAIYGSEEFPQEKLLLDTAAIVQSARNVFEEHPCLDFTFITHLVSKNGGGLEHKNSTSLQFDRELLLKEEGYQKFLSLVAHEYFHIWNGKRLRPAPLGPFDYNQENYCSLLWFVEGFTSYYEKLILHQAKLIDDQAFIQVHLDRINYIENQPGIKVQSLSAASWDAWIKAYRPNENSNNATISYYTKGAVVALLLDWEVILQSQGAYCLDDVMRLLYHKHYKDEDRGFTEAELQAALEQFTGQSLEDFFQAYIHGVEALPYAEYFGAMGLTWQKDQEDSPLSLGIQVKDKKIKIVKRGSCGHQCGLNVHDEIVAVNHQAIDDLDTWIQNRQMGEAISMQVIRDGKLKHIPITLIPSSEETYQAEPLASMNAIQQARFQKWLRK